MQQEECLPENGTLRVGSKDHESYERVIFMNPSVKKFTTSDRIRQDLISQIESENGSHDDKQIQIIQTLSTLMLSRTPPRGWRYVNSKVRLGGGLRWCYQSDLHQGYASALVEAISGDIRTMHDSVSDETIVYRRNLPDCGAVDYQYRPRSWHVFSSPEDEYRLDNLSKSERVNWPDFREVIWTINRIMNCQMSDGVTFRFLDENDHYLGRTLERVDDDFESKITVNVSMTRSDALAISNEMRHAYSEWCVNGIENLLLAPAYSMLSPIPNGCVVVYGPSESGKSLWGERIRRMVGGVRESFVLSFSEMIGGTYTGKGIVFKGMSRSVAWIDDLPETSSNRASLFRAWPYMKPFITGVAPYEGKQMRENAIDGATIRSHLFIASNYDLDVHDIDVASSRRVFAFEVSPSERMSKMLQRLKTDEMDTGDPYWWPELLLSCESWVGGVQWKRDVRYVNRESPFDITLGNLVRYIDEHDRYVVKTGEVADSEGFPILSARQVGGFKVLHDLGITTLKDSNGRISPRKVNGRSSSVWIPDGSPRWKMSVNKFSDHQSSRNGELTHQYEADVIVRYLMDHGIYLLKSGEILDSSGIPITGSRQFGYGWLQSIGVKKGTPRKLNGKSSATWIPDLESDNWRESVSRVSKPN